MRLQDNIDILTDPNTIFVAFISYGKDSLAMLRAIKLLGLPLHRIIHTEVWATDTIPADLPPMVEFKAKADKIIKELYGIEVEHVCAMATVEEAAHYTSASRERETASRENGSHTRECSTTSCKAENSLAQSKDFRKQSELGARKSSVKKLTYEDIFYRRFKSASGGVEANKYGFATIRNPYCRGELKNIRIPDAGRKLVYNLPQAKHTDSQSLSTEGNGANGSSSFRKSPENEGRK